MHEEENAGDALTRYKEETRLDRFIDAVKEDMRVIGVT